MKEKPKTLFAQHSSNSVQVYSQALPVGLGNILKLSRLQAKPSMTMGVSYFTAIPITNNKHLFPSFFSIAPSDFLQAYGLVRMVAHFGWTWVGILSQEGDYGRLSSQIFKEEIAKAGACVAFAQIIPTRYSLARTKQIMEVIKRSTAKVIAILSFDVYINPFMEELSMLDRKGRVWLATEAPSVSDKNIIRAVGGTLGMVNHKGLMPGFEEYIFNLKPSKYPKDPYVKVFWEEAFGCQWPGLSSGQSPIRNNTDIKHKPCSGQENMVDLDVFSNIRDLRVTYNIYKSVYAVAHSLHAMLSCHPGDGPFANGSCANTHDYKPWQLLHYISQVHFEANPNEEIFFDVNGYTRPIYDVVNWQVNSKGLVDFVKVGTFNTSAPQGLDLVINDSAILWNHSDQQPTRSVCSETCAPGFRKVVRNGEPTCCFDCLPCAVGEISNKSDSTECWRCPDDQWPNSNQDTCMSKEVEFLAFTKPMGAMLASVAVTGSLFPVAILLIFLKHRDTAIVKANHRALSYLLLLGLTICYFCPLIFIGQPNVWSCMLRQIAFGILFTFSISCMLAKTIMVVFAFKATNPNSLLQRCIGPNMTTSVVLFNTLVQAGLCTYWLVSSPPFPQMNVTFQLGKIILECNEGSTKAFWCMLGYMCFLAGISFVVAFLARNLPNSFNEAKHITFSMLVFGTVWASFIPAYLSTWGIHKVAIELFAILASNTGLVICMFVPKCYIILLRPDMNNKEYLLGSKSLQKRFNKKRNSHKK